jgi:hypothetical protein
MGKKLDAQQVAGLFMLMTRGQSEQEKMIRLTWVLQEVWDSAVETVLKAQKEKDAVPTEDIRPV